MPGLGLDLFIPASSWEAAEEARRGRTSSGRAWTQTARLARRDVPGKVAKPVLMPSAAALGGRGGVNSVPGKKLAESLKLLFWTATGRQRPESLLQ